MTLYVNVVYLTKNFVRRISYEHYSKNQRKYICQIMDNGDDIKAYKIYLHNHHFGGKKLFFQKWKNFVMDFFPGNMQDGTVVSRYMVRHIVSACDYPKNYQISYFSENMAIFMKIGLFIKNLCELFFQRTSHILHVKSLILMYYFIFFTIPSLLGKK